MTQANFIPVARLQFLLARELIADPNVAIAEFVKNSYDAFAKEVHIEFRLDGRSTAEQTLLIIDDGDGMDLKSFQKNWMRPGFSDKAQIPVNSLGKAGRRIPIGEKGLGRLAAGRLGERMSVYTRTTKAKPWVHLDVNWEDFNTMEKDLHKIPFTIKESKKAPSDKFMTGTQIKIEGLTDDWTGKLRGRKVSGRSDLRLGRLAEHLSVLVQPLAIGKKPFSVSLSSDSPELKEFNHKIEPANPKFLDYQCDIIVTERNGRIRIDRKVLRSQSVANTVERPIETKKRVYADELQKLDPDLGLPEELECGRFTARMYYAPESKNAALKDLGLQQGVHLYRDNVLVEPYGQRDDDWLEATSWKASRQGHAPIQPKFLNGHFSISKVANSNLRDMANRQGLIDNSAYRSFLALARSEFRAFANLVYGEFVFPQWESEQQKAKAAAEKTLGFGISIIRQMAHTIRQSTAALGADLFAVSSIENDLEMPPSLRQELMSIRQRARSNIDNIDEIVDKFLGYDQSALESMERLAKFDVSEALQEAVRSSQALADSLNVKVAITGRTSSSVVFNREVLIQSIQELITNGIHATASAGRRHGSVRISVDKSKDGHSKIVVADDGAGIPDEVRDDLFNGVAGTKGHPSAGLMMMKQIVGLFGGDVDLAETSSKGSIFHIDLPTSKDLQRLK